ncbi:MAG TPA: AAA family ATPase [Nannocystis exedens]|nr:AAA family ATPase [Nannocystis exedens]
MSLAGPLEPGARPSRRRTPQSRGHHCSCELLIELCSHEPVRGILGEYGVGDRELAHHHAELHGEIGNEPADWRLRLVQRGGSRNRGELDQLLAIVRTAESHAYQLLERVGIAGAHLRKRVIEQMRVLGPTTLQSPSPRPTRQSVRTETNQRGEASTNTAPSARRSEPLAAEASRGRRRQHSSPHSAQETRIEQIEIDDREEPKSQAADKIESAATKTQRRPKIQPLDPNDLPPLHGHDALLARLADSLLRRSPRPPLLLGARGSGRSLVATHLARVLDRPVFHLSAPSYTGETELRRDLSIVAKNSGVAILDDLDRLLADAPPEFLGVLSQIWTSGRPPVLTILSHEGRGRLASWLPGLAATLDVIDMPALEGDDLRAAVKIAAPAIIAEHRVHLAADAHLGELARLALDFLGGPLALPGRALDLLDLSCARVAREGCDRVHRETWVDIVCERTGVPRERVLGQGGQDMLDLEADLGRRVVGHEHVLHTIAQLVRRNRAGFGSQRPVLSALLLGPSGVGKTEIAKSLAAALFDRNDAMLRLDMSEYAEAHAVARIVGAPPGYIGHEQGGALTDPLLKQPHCVILLDEIEKAHRDVHQLLLQVFDEGRLTDGRGRTIDFRHALIIMTSNLGGEHLVQANPDRRGRGRTTTGPRLDEEAVLAAARSAFPTELWNRIEAPLILHPLGRRELARICHRLVKSSSERLFAERGIQYQLSDGACDLLIDRCGEDATLGARPLRHLLARMVEPLIADAVLRGQIRAGLRLDIIVKDDELRIESSRGLALAR